MLHIIDTQVRDTVDGSISGHRPQGDVVAGPFRPTSDDRVRLERAVRYHLAITPGSRFASRRARFHPAVSAPPPLVSTTSVRAGTGRVIRPERANAPGTPEDHRMAVKLRLRREGTVKRPHYRIVATDARSPRDGRFIEIVGNYHPLENPSVIEVNEERALHWLQVGAQPSDAVKKLLRITGVWETFKPGDKPQRERAEGRTKTSKKAKARRAEAAEGGGS
jgi:small subunit ribosomal protein S16